MARTAKMKTRSGTRKAADAQAPAVELSKTNSYEQIVRAAYKCFDKYGIDGTSIENIADEAGVTRPTVYRYFAGKKQIVDLISAEESRKVNAEVRKRLVRTKKFDALLTEALVLIVRIAIENPYVRRVLYYHELVSTPETELQSLQRQWWGGFLQRAAERGELASDLGTGEVIQWLVLTQRMLLTYLESGPVSDTELQRLIRRFIVEPLLRSPDRTAS
jgi:AcrR family transcriptional regulator